MSKDNAAGVAGHLVMVGRLLDSDLDAARAHAETAVRRAGRVASVREIRGLVAYREEEWALALSEFRTARRLAGDNHLLPLMVDSERGLGRPERALDLASSPEAATLTRAEQMEMRIVVSGVRRDLGQPEAAAVGLRGPELDPTRRAAWSPRLFYAYAEALLALGDVDGAREWFRNAVDADENLETDAAERLDELDGIIQIDLLEGEDDEDDENEDDEDTSAGDGSDSSEGAPEAGHDRAEDPVEETAGEADAGEADDSADAGDPKESS